MRERYIPYMSWVDVEEKIKAGVDTAVFPMGSTEQHGRHSPLGTDSIIALEMSVRIARIIGALVAPTLTVGYSPHHMRFPGSMTLSIDTYRRVVSEMVESLMRHGMKKFAFLNAHAGNRAPSDVTANDLKHKHGEEIQVMVVDMLRIQTSDALKAEAEKELGRKLSDPWGAHAGEQETSGVMYFKPELVNFDRVSPPIIPEEFLSITMDPDVRAIIFNWPRYTETGTWGDASNASAEQGDVFYRILSEKLAEKIQNHWEK